MMISRVPMQLSLMMFFQYFIWGAWYRLEAFVGIASGVCRSDLVRVYCFV